MPRYKGDPPGPSSVIHMKVKNDVMEKVEKAKKDGYWADSSQGAFMGYLISLGINVYERRILPVEVGNDDGVLPVNAFDDNVQMEDKVVGIGPTETEGLPRRVKSA